MVHVGVFKVCACSDFEYLSRYCDIYEAAISSFAYIQCRF